MKPFEFALKEYGTWEWAGKEHNPRVLKYFKETGHSWVNNDETAWCAAFVNWCLKQAGKPNIGKLNARSFLDLGQPTNTPELGDVVVFWRNNKDSWEGHVAFFIAETKNNVYVLGGNQNQQVNISSYPKAQILGYRKIPDVKSITT